MAPFPPRSRSVYFDCPPPADGRPSSRRPRRPHPRSPRCKTHELRDGRPGPESSRNVPRSRYAATCRFRGQDRRAPTRRSFRTPLGLASLVVWGRQIGLSVVLAVPRGGRQGSGGRLRPRSSVSVPGGHFEAQADVLHATVEPRWVFRGGHKAVARVETSRVFVDGVDDYQARGDCLTGGDCLS